MRERYQILCLFILSLILFLPGLSAGYFIFDDLGIVTALRENGLGSIRFQANETSRYLRPLLMLSFWFDIFLWEGRPGLMRLENILLHATNAVLVFAVTKQLLVGRPKTESYLSLLAASLFLIHPVTSEAVNWISGRSDLLAALFVLAGFLLLVKGLQKNRGSFALGAAISLTLGCFAKEVAFFALFGGGLLFLFYRPQEDQGRNLPLIWQLQRVWPFAGGMLLYLAARVPQGRSMLPNLAGILEKSTSPQMGVTDQIFQSLVALGFYLKKLILPFPLNFAIDQVSPLYVGLGLLGLGAILLLLTRRDASAAAVLLLFLCVVPALLNALYRIAWTPYAERYLYLPAAFLAIFIGTLQTPVPSAVWLRNGLLALLLITFLPQTWHRNQQWKDSVDILADAVRQNPDNLTLRNNYGIVLTEHQGPAAGRKVFAGILVLAPEHPEAHFNRANIALLLLDDPQLARADLESFFEGTLEPTPRIAELMTTIAATCKQKNLECE